MKIKFILAESLSFKINLLNVNLNKVFFKILFKWLYKSVGNKSYIIKPLYVTHDMITLGDSVFIRDSARIECVRGSRGICSNPEIVFEDNVSIEQRCHITSAGKLVIGKNTTILFDVMITDIDHEYQQIGVPISAQPLIVQETRIGENCFIGSGAKIQAGTILGKQCIVGTNAVVRGHFPDYCVIVGVPAKIVKRYNPKTEQWEKTNANGEFLSEL